MQIPSPSQLLDMKRTCRSQWHYWKLSLQAGDLQVRLRCTPECCAVATASPDAAARAILYKCSASTDTRLHRVLFDSMSAPLHGESKTCETQPLLLTLILRRSSMSCGTLEAPAAHSHLCQLAQVCGICRSTLPYVSLKWAAGTLPLL